MKLCKICNNEIKEQEYKKYCKKCRKKWKRPQDHFYHLNHHQSLKYKQQASQRALQWAKKNKEKIRLNLKKYIKKIRLNALKIYSKNNIPSCNICGETNINVLALDHIYNNGKKDLKGISLYRKAINIKDKNQYQVLCYNCNWKKHLINLANKQHSEKYNYYHKRNLEFKKKCISYFSNNTNKCSMCGCNDLDVLCMDHIYNNGSEERKKILGKNKGGIYTYYISKPFPYHLKNTIQILCLNCNILKYRIDKSIIYT